jgi:uncharacterized protein VirK/YbjX
MWNLIKTLVKTAPLVHRNRTPGGIVKRVKYCLRGLAFARCTQEWFELLQAPEMAAIAKNHPYLFHKLQRPYLNRLLTTRQRLDALKHHYKFVLGHFSGQTLEEIYAPGGKTLVELTAEEVGTFELRLACSGKQKEGDLLVGLAKKGDWRFIASLSFSVSKYGRSYKEIFIGGLQGNKLASKELVVSITRALYGLRPKALLVYVVQHLAADWEMTRLRAVSDDTHIYRHFQKQKEVTASYDEFWIECGGTLSPDGFFDLPVTFVSRDISTIRANKRQMYRRRYAMFAEIDIQIKNKLSAKSSTRILAQAERN